MCISIACITYCASVIVWKFTYIQMYINAYILICNVHTYVRKYICTYIRMCICIIYVHTYIQYTYIYVLV